MAIPDLDPASGNLPPGIHPGTWEEIDATFGTTQHRKGLLRGLHRALISLRDAGCARAYINGSFTTAKEDPGDYDGCWEPQGVDPSKLDPVLLDFSQGRAAQKAKFGGELFIASGTAGPGSRFLDFFQRDKFTGEPKGIVAIDLGGLK
jgi:hypothetical protein